MTPEGRVKKLIDLVLDGRSDVWYFKPVQSGYGKRALDYVCCIKGYFVGIEAKRPTKDPTPFQRSTSRDIYLAGGSVWFISTPETVPLFAKWIDEL